MKIGDTYKVTTEEGKVITGEVTLLSISRFSIGHSIKTHLFCDMESIEKIKAYKKKSVGNYSKIGVGRA